MAVQESRIPGSCSSLFIFIIRSRLFREATFVLFVTARSGSLPFSVNHCNLRGIRLHSEHRERAVLRAGKSRIQVRFVFDAILNSVKRPCMDS